MTDHILERRQLVRAPLAKVFAFFAEAHNLEVITPPWLGFQVLTPEPVEMRAGTLIDYRLHTHRFAEHAEGTLVHDRVRYRLPLGRLGTRRPPGVRAPGPRARIHLPA